MRQGVVGSEEEAVVESAVFRTFIAPGWVLFVCFCIVKVVMKQDCSALGRCSLGSDWPF